MGKLSKAAIAHLNNLTKASSKSHRATVEEVPDSDVDDIDYSPEDTEANSLDSICGRFFAPEDNCDDSSSDSDLMSLDSELEERDLDEDEEAEIRDDVALLTFASILRRAQKVASEAENKKWGERKRSKRYTGNSTRSMRCHAQKRRKLTTNGQKSIRNWFPIRKSPSPVMQNLPMGIQADENQSASSEPVSNSII
jgi:hypothetical protein